MEKKKHNGIISLWKFLFSLIIVALHLAHSKENYLNNFKYIFSAGSIVVDFFFIISGYLMAKKALNAGEIKKENLGSETFKYIWKKIKSFFPYVLIAYFCALAIRISRMGNNINISGILNTIFDLLFFYSSGIKYNSVIPVAWYISAMLICMVVYYPLLLKYKKNFVYIVCPVIVFFISGYISHNLTNISKADIWVGFVYKGMLRAIFELPLGCIIFLFSEKIKKTNFTNICRIMLTFIEIVGFSSIFFIVNTKNAHTRYDFVMILYLSICIAIAFSEKTFDYNILSNKAVYYLEALSLPIYLNHSWIISLGKDLIKTENFITSNYYYYLITIILITVVISVIEMRIVKKIKEKEIINKIKEKLIKV